MKSKLNKIKLEKFDIAAIIFLILGIIFMIVRVQYSIADEDEGVYAAWVYRLCMGDGMIVDEWHLAQWMAFIVYPFAKIFYLIQGKTGEGIMLYFRFLYVVFQAAVSSVIYLRLRKKINYMAIFAAGFIFFCMPMYHIALSYISLGIGFVSLFMVLLIDKWKYDNLRIIVLGILFSLIVLCNPIMAIIFFVYALLCAVRGIGKRSEKLSKVMSKEEFGIKNFGLFFTGILIIFIIFILFVLSRASINDLIENIPMMLNDPEHTFGAGEQILTPLESLTTLLVGQPVLYIIGVPLLIVCLIDKKRLQHRKIYFSISLANSLYNIAYIMIARATYDWLGEGWICENDSPYYFWAMAIVSLGVTAFALTENRSKCIRQLLIVGFTYATMLDVSSDMSGWSFNQGCAVLLIASAYAIYDLIVEIKPEMNVEVPALDRIIAIALPVVLVLQMSMQIMMMADVKGTCIDIYYTDTSTMVRIDKGPMKGFIVPKETDDVYGLILDDLDYIVENCDGNFLSVGKKSWEYLYVNKRFATYCSWVHAGRWFGFEVYDYKDADRDRLLKYWEMKPDRIPEYIYVCEKNYEGYQIGREKLAERIKDDLCNIFNCTVTKGNVGYILHVEDFK